MLHIREKQWRVLAGLGEARFRERAAETVRKHWPEETERLGAQGVEGSVEAAVEQARELGMTREYDIQRYLNLMYALGFDFRSNPDLPWVDPILKDPGLDQVDRMNALTARAQEYLVQLDAQAEGAGQ